MTESDEVNFQGYSMHLADDLVGLGVSAITQVGNMYLQNVRNIDDYYARIDSGAVTDDRGVRLTREDQIRRHVIMSLICEMSLDTAECSSLFGIDFNEHFSAELTALEALAADGLLTLSDTEIKVQERGRPFLRNICMPFDAYLTGQHTQRFSATV